MALKAFRPKNDGLHKKSPVRKEPGIADGHDNETNVFNLDGHYRPKEAGPRPKQATGRF